MSESIELLRERCYFGVCFSALFRSIWYGLLRALFSEVDLRIEGDCETRLHYRCVCGTVLARLIVLDGRCQLLLELRDAGFLLLLVLLQLLVLSHQGRDLLLEELQFLIRLKYGAFGLLLLAQGFLELALLLVAEAVHLIAQLNELAVLRF